MDIVLYGVNRKGLVRASGGPCFVEESIALAPGRTVSAGNFRTKAIVQTPPNHRVHPRTGERRPPSGTMASRGLYIIGVG